VTRAPLARLVAAATLVAAAAVVLGPTTPASAASCTSGSGVTVVVDPGALGGALTAACDSGSGQAASARYADVGVAISYVQRQPGFVCRVNGAPASDPCVNTPPADAYWGLWWTDGESGTWSYSSIGVTGLQVPEGGAVALAWQQGGTRRTPGIAAPVHAAPAPSPTKAPTKTPTKAPTSSPTKTPTRAPTAPTTSPPTSSAPASPSRTPSTSPSAPASSPTGSASGSATPGPSGSPSRSPRTKPPGTPTPSEDTSSPAGDSTSTSPSTGTADATPTGSSAEPVADSARVPTWVTLAVLVALVAALGAMTVAARRRRGDQP
jgi:hypothetical protein